MRLIAILFVLLLAFAIYLSTVDTEVPIRTIEQDVSDEILAK
ncbi:MAG: hypothetical protein ACT4OE_09395 [Sphingosinicella sp.]